MPAYILNGGKQILRVEKPPRELSVEEIVSLTFRLYTSKFLPFFLPFLIAGVVTGLFSYAVYLSFPLPTLPTVYTTEEVMKRFLAFVSALMVIGFLTSLLNWVVGTLTTGVAIRYASDNIEKGSADLGASFHTAWSKLPSLLVAQLAIGILTAIGTLFFLVPGIIIAVMFSLTIPAIIIEQKGAFESMGRSRRLVSNRWLKTFALLLIIGIIGLIVVGVVRVLAIVYGIAYPNIEIPLTSIISSVVAPISPIATTYLYYSMVVREAPLPRPPTF